MSNETRIDHRRQLLADKIRHKRTVLAEAMRPPGANIPLTKQQTNEEALAFWRKNRYTPIGLQVLSQWPMDKVLELDNWLGQHPDPTIEKPLL